MTSEIAKEIEKLSEDFGIDKKRSIGEVAHDLGVEPHVIRFWEDQFPQIKPEIGKGGRRYYYNKQIKVLKRIKKFLHEEGYTIAGLQKLLKKRKSNDLNKDEDIDIIMVGGEKSSIEREIDDFVEIVQEQIAQDLDSQGQETEISAQITVSSMPNANFVANSRQATNINRPLDNNSGGFSKEQRDELFSLFKNITKNLGDLKMLLRS